MFKDKCVAKPVVVLGIVAQQSAQMELIDCQPQTTARYAHLDRDPVKVANEAIGRRIAAAMAGKQAAKVVKLRGKQR